MKALKKLTSLALSLITAAVLAVTAYAGGLEPIEYNGKNYVCQPGIARFVMNKNGKVLKANKPDPNNEYDPNIYIAKLNKLKKIGTKEATDNEIERIMYSDGKIILMVWKCDINSYADSEEMLKKYSADMFYEASVFKPSAMLKTIDGKIYYKDENGNNLTGWQTIGELKYYFRKSGEAVTKNTVIDGIRYKFNSNGVCKGKYTGFTSSSKGKKYWKKGVLVKNKEIKIKDNLYYADADGYVSEVNPGTAASDNNTFLYNGAEHYIFPEWTAFIIKKDGKCYTLGDPIKTVEKEDYKIKDGLKENPALTSLMKSGKSLGKLKYTSGELKSELDIKNKYFDKAKIYANSNTDEYYLTIITSEPVCYVGKTAVYLAANAAK